MNDKKNRTITNNQRIDLTLWAKQNAAKLEGLTMPGMADVIRNEPSLGFDVSPSTLRPLCDHIGIARQTILGRPAKAKHTQNTTSKNLYRACADLYNLVEALQRNHGVEFQLSKATIGMAANHSRQIRQRETDLDSMAGGDIEHVNPATPPTPHPAPGPDA